MATHEVDKPNETRTRSSLQPEGVDEIGKHLRSLLADVFHTVPIENSFIVWGNEVFGSWNSPVIKGLTDQGAAADAGIRSEAAEDLEKPSSAPVLA